MQTFALSAAALVRVLKPKSSQATHDIGMTDGFSGRGLSLFQDRWVRAL